MTTKKGGRPANYTREQVRFALERLFAPAGRVPTDLMQVPIGEVLPILATVFGISPTVRPEPLQAVIDDLFAEFVERQRKDDRARLSPRQREKMSELNTALDNALIDIFTSENDALARAEFESLRRADAEKDRLKQKLDDAEAELAAARAETIKTSEALRTREAELASAAAEIASLKARLAHLDGRIATYAHLEGLLISAKSP